MAPPRVAPYGSWKSPITSDLIVAATISLDQVVLDGLDVYWVEGRPAEGGRNLVVRRTPDGSVTDVTPAPFNARTRVHEYPRRDSGCLSVCFAPDGKRIATSLRDSTSLVWEVPQGGKQ